MDKKQGGQQAEEQADEVFPVDEGGPVEKVEKPKLVTSIASTVDEGGDEAARSIGKPKEDPLTASAQTSAFKAAESVRNLAEIAGDDDEEAEKASTDVPAAARE